MGWDFWLAAGIVGVAVAGWAFLCSRSGSGSRRDNPLETFPVECHRLQPAWHLDRTVADAFRQRVGSQWAARKRRWAATILVSTLHA